VCIQILCVQGRTLWLARANSKILAAEGNLGQQISPNKAEKTNGLNLEEKGLPGCCSCHAIDISSPPCKELKHEACDMLPSLLMSVISQLRRIGDSVHIG